MSAIEQWAKNLSNGLCPDPETTDEEWEEWLNDVPDEIPEARTCPLCGGRMRERQGKYGPFLGCEEYPDCRHTE
ncbi:MAG TPA: topoisomerase DNA-binding C4 zinc finger domain-containing protein [Anaerolineae bacterium]|nr:topoisomerase DNA-binding C4 zinc finger domain-containing protein [Anaerolineae bacterium]